MASRLLAALAEDYRAMYEHRGESPGRMRALAVPRMLTNPSMHAIVLVRLMLASPRALTFLWRNVLISKHGIDIERGCEIGPGLMLPHPVGIVFGASRLGARVMISHHVTLGAARKPRTLEHLPFPTLGDGVVVHPGSVIAGGVTIGADTVIGALSFVDADVPAGSVWRRGR